MNDFIKHIFSPWKVMVVSILTSIVLYVGLSVIIEIPNFVLGLFLSAIIPAIISLPIAYLFIQYTNKIAQQNEELTRLDFTTKKMFSVIAHDIKNPITTIKTVLNAHQDGHLNASETKDYLSSLNQKTDQLLDLIDDLLSWSQKQINHEELTIETFSAGELIQPTLELYNEEILQKNLSIQVNNTNTIISCEKGSYSFMIRNIVQNAIKFSYPNGIITIDVIKKNSNTYTIIRDTGKGISAKNLRKLIETNEIFTTRGTKMEKGTGIGIQTSHYFAKLNGGKIDIESKEGKGTSVTISLPTE
ncbi:MAG: sensor histidine kinase [Salibacteraceae bacterium]